MEKAVSESYKTLKIDHDRSKFFNQKISFFRLKHDVQQAKYLISKNYKISGAEQFQKIGNEILEREKNKESNGIVDHKILLSDNEIKSLLPYHKAGHVYQIPKIAGICIAL